MTVDIGSLKKIFLEAGKCVKIFDEIYKSASCYNNSMHKQKKTTFILIITAQPKYINLHVYLCINITPSLL